MRFVAVVKYNLPINGQDGHIYQLGRRNGSIARTTWLQFGDANRDTIRSKSKPRSGLSIMKRDLPESGIAMVIRNEISSATQTAMGT
jgi:hypothetical protein